MARFSSKTTELHDNAPMLRTLAPKSSTVGKAWLPALVTTAVWAVLGLSAVAWGLALWPSDSQPLAVSLASVEVTPMPVLQAADIAKVLGSSSAAPASSLVAAAPTAVGMSLLGVAIAGKANAIGCHGQHGLGAAGGHINPSAVGIGPGIAHLEHLRATQAPMKSPAAFGPRV